MPTKFVRSDVTKTGCTWELPVATKWGKLESTSTNPTDMKSKNKNYMRTQEGIGDLYQYNLLLYPSLTVSDLEPFATNPGIFDDGKI